MKYFTSKKKIQFDNLVKFIFTNELAQFRYKEFYSIQKFHYSLCQLDVDLIKFNSSKNVEQLINYEKVDSAKKQFGRKQ